MLASQLLRSIAATAALFSFAIPANAAERKFEYVMTLGSAGAGEGQFNYVEDFAFTADRTLLVTDAGHAYVQVFDRVTGQFLHRFGGKGEGKDNFDKPEGIAVDQTGNVFVAD